LYEVFEGNVIIENLMTWSDHQITHFTSVIHLYLLGSIRQRHGEGEEDSDADIDGRDLQHPLGGDDRKEEQHRLGH